MAEESTQGAGPTVSVLMSVYNGRRYLAEAINSILGQTFTDFEFLIVDDGSADGSSDIIEKFARKDNRIVVLRNEANLGLTRSLNLGIERARGKYLARQDADDLSLPKRLERQVACLDSNPAAGIVGSAYLIIDEAGKPLGERTPTTDANLLKKELLIKNHALNHSSVMARTGLIKELGGYDETLQYAQDYDLWWRLSGVAELANLEEKLIKWRVSGAQISASARVDQLECMLEISLRIISSVSGGETLPAEPYKRLWMACNSDKLTELLPDDLEQLKPLWELLSSDSRYPPATLNSLKDTVYRLYRAGNRSAAGQLSAALKQYFGLRPGKAKILGRMLKSLIPRK